MKSATRYFLPRIGFLAVALSCASEAAVVVTTSKSAAASPPTFSTTDLGVTAFLSSSGTGTGGTGTTDHGRLFDGLIGNTAPSSGEVRLAIGNTITLNLNTTVNTLGYDITGIDTIAGWDTFVDGRSNQGFSIMLTFINNSTATLVSPTHWQPNSPVSYWTKVSFTNSGGGTLNSDTVALNGGTPASGPNTVATGVKSITWTMSVAANAGGWVGYREFDVFGTATVPEPSGVVLFSLGMGAMLLRRRRN